MEGTVDDWQIEASAPGKVVLTGEYAVLAGAPALVAAVDRRVVCRLAVRRAGGWRLIGTGFATREAWSKADMRRAPPRTLAAVAGQALPARDTPEHVEIHIDSSACHLRGHKLGIGSSAAVVTALAAALDALRGAPPHLPKHLPKYLDLHAGFQGGGSGLDVAAAFAGGVIRYQARRSAPAPLPSPLARQAVFCGASTVTAERLAAFEAWRAGGSPPALRRLVDAARSAATSTDDATRFEAAFGDYADTLARFDRAAQLGIFGPCHEALRALAAEAGVAYKPCGAGGGDIGLALCADQQRIADFHRRVRAAARAGRSRMTPIDLPLASDGVRVRARQRRGAVVRSVAHQSATMCAGSDGFGTGANCQPRLAKRPRKEAERQRHKQDRDASRGGQTDGTRWS